LYFLFYLMYGCLLKKKIKTTPGTGQTEAKGRDKN
jgi:hypothetical protein